MNRDVIEYLTEQAHRYRLKPNFLLVASNIILDTNQRGERVDDVTLKGRTILKYATQLAKGAEEKKKGLDEVPSDQLSMLRQDIQPIVAEIAMPGPIQIRHVQAVAEAIGEIVKVNLMNRTSSFKEFIKKTLPPVLQNALISQEIWTVNPEIN